MMKVLFVGHFAPLILKSWQTEVGSIPGNQVQREIIDELRSGQAVTTFEALALRPLASWPKEPLTVAGAQEADIHFAPLLNLPVVKNFLFAIFLLVRAIRTRPSVLIAYNSYLFENIAILIYSRVFERRARTAIIIQDIHTSRTSLRSWLRSTYERMGLRLTKYFSLILPVSKYIIDDFGLSNCDYRVFPGGVTEAAHAVSAIPSRKEDFAVFAGALTLYNGVDILAREWIKQAVPHELHIFGQGPLYDELERLSKHHNCIRVHGLIPEREVVGWLARARWNFCLRLSRGIDQRYFFPSKFFTLACASGAIITNGSFDAPEDLKRFTHVIKDDARDLRQQLQLAQEKEDLAAIDQRKAHVLTNYTWAREVAGMLDALARAQR